MDVYRQPELEPGRRGATAPRRRLLLKGITVICALWTIRGRPNGVYPPPPPVTWDLYRTDHSLVFLERYGGRWSIACVTVLDDLLVNASLSRMRYLRQRAIVVDPTESQVFATTQDEQMIAVSVGVPALMGASDRLYTLAVVWTIAQFLLLVLRISNRVAAIVKRGRRVRRGLCGACGYNLTGNVSGICPECGTMIPAEWRRGIRR